MTNRILLSHPLRNGLTLLCLDRSKQIAVDRWYVCVLVEIEIPVEKRWFENLDVDDATFARIVDLLGDFVVFSQKRERNFVGKEDKDKIVGQICDRVEKMGETCFGHDHFAGKFILKTVTNRKIQR